MAKKYEVKKSVIHGTKILKPGEIVDLDETTKSTKALLESGQIAPAKAEK